ncbi:MAG: lipoprotein-releasing system ATP-binding protein [Myxococcales bacterium]|nr:lipoprotein-releasing system ATP-binding protein [Myxococcales bacterium]
MSPAATAEPPRALVVAAGVKKSFQHMGRTLEVLRGIDLTINEGEMVGIVGQSGAGKSTLLHCIGTLDIVSAGSIKVNGEELTTMSGNRLADLRNRTIGFVFQFHHLLPEFNALENVLMPGLIQGLSRKEMEPRAMSLLEEVGLRDRVLHRPGELSGGEQQRVALARALVLEPKLLLADEPTGNLDSRTSEQMHQLFYKVNETRKTTIVIVTHNAALAAGMARVVTLRDGKVERDEYKKKSSYRDAPGEAMAAADELPGTGKVDVR